MKKILKINGSFYGNELGSIIGGSIKSRCVDGYTPMVGGGTL